MIHSLAGHQCDVLNDVVDVAIGIFLHTRSSGTDPATKSAELHGVRLVTTDHTILFEIALEVLSKNTCLHTSHAIFLVDPFDLVHSGHVTTNNHSFFFHGKFETLRNIGATAIGHNHNIVLISEGGEDLAVFSRHWVNDHVNILFQLTLSKSPSFLECLSMGVMNSFIFVERSSREILLSKLLNKSVINLRRGHFKLSSLFHLVIDVNRQ